MDYIVNFIWDDEAGVWIATSEDIPGLVLEDDSYDTLAMRVKEVLPELLIMNHMPINGTLCLKSEQRQRVMYSG